MLWTAWTNLLTTTLIISAIIAWWFTESRTAHVRASLVGAAGVLLFCVFWALAPDVAQHFIVSLYRYLLHAVAGPRFRWFFINHATMLITGAAVVWYALLRCHGFIPSIVRSCLTLATLQAGS
jgi:hypothetical protein